jgi:hypothetical protein
MTSLTNCFLLVEEDISRAISAALIADLALAKNDRSIFKAHGRQAQVSQTKGSIESG